MVVLTDLWLSLDVALKIVVICQHPSEHGLLYLLVVFLLEEFVTKEFHGTDHEELASTWTNIKRSNWSVCWETDWARGEKSMTWLPNVYGRSIGIHKL